ncbi:MAG: hypothetical protein IT438_05945 [Phycisphaerales bacterium]|nr:hypothetical protein [Phycisphaerales bacterium]
MTDRNSAGFVLIRALFLVFAALAGGCIFVDRGGASDQRAQLAEALVRCRIAPGVTTRAEVEQRFGPTGRWFDHQGVLIYSIGLDGDRLRAYPFIAEEDHPELFDIRGHCSCLVLAFDNRGVLTQQSIIAAEAE